MQAVKCVVVGDTGVGKTSMLLGYVHQAFPSDSLQMFSLMENPFPWDCGTQQLMPNVRGLINLTDTQMTDSDHLVIQAVETKWVPEVHHHCPCVPLVLVGTKLDLSKDETGEAIPQEEAEKVAERIGAKKHVRLSALTQQGLNAAFEETVRVVIGPPAPKSSRFCVLL